MKNNLTSIVDITTISVQAEVSQQSYKNIILQEEILNLNTMEDYSYYISHKVNNVIHKNGRIYLDIKDGKLTANSVSPYSEKFWLNIENGIKPLVEAFYKKRYLTYSSCESHGMDFRRYIGLAFCDEESREYVINHIKALKLFGIKLNLLNSVVNIKTEINNKTKKPSFSKHQPEENYIFNPEDEILNFNVQFHRNYEKYYFLEIELFPAISYQYEGIFKEIKKIFLRPFKNYFMKKNTKAVTKLINSPQFKKYKF